MACFSLVLRIRVNDAWSQHLVNTWAQPLWLRSRANRCIKYPYRLCTTLLAYHLQGGSGFPTELSLGVWDNVLYKQQ